MMLLVKTTVAQELGYSAGVPGQRGRYLFIPKRWYRYFPPLTDQVQNDKYPVRLIAQSTRRAHVALFVWHNDRLIDEQGTRNERRVYLSNRFFDDVSGMMPGDSVVLEPVLEGAREFADSFRVWKVSQGNRDYQRKLESLFEERGIDQQGNYREIDAGLHDLIGYTQPKTRCALRLGVDETESAGDVDVNLIGQLFTDGAGNELAQRFTRPLFRDFVLAGYERKCAITRTSLVVGRFTNIEAAHIKPDEHGGSLLPSNGIALSRDLHWAFDKGAFSIDESNRVVVHPEVTSTQLREINGQCLFEPEDTFFRPDPVNVKYHRENIYGLFVQSGQYCAASDEGTE